MSTHHTLPLLGCYARSCVWAPLFRNSGSAPDASRLEKSKIQGEQLLSPHRQMIVDLEDCL